MNADDMIAIAFLGALLGLVGGALNAIVDGPEWEPRQGVAGIVGGMVAATLMAPINPVSRVDLVLLVLCGFLAADVFEALWERR